MYKNIKLSIIEEMMIFKKSFYRYIYENKEQVLLKQIKNYLLKNKGKLIRPIIVFLIAKMLNNNKKIPQKTYKTAYLVQIIHTASIIHDDIVDNSDSRRGVSSIKKIWGNKLAVLIGDYLLSKCLSLVIKHKYDDLLKIISTTIKKITQGELLQIENMNKHNITEKLYNKIIKYKTASLISACCEGGACSIGADKKTILEMKKLGELIGMVFQIKDDLLDYEYDMNNISTHNNINDKTITLPLVYILKNVKKKKNMKY